MTKYEIVLENWTSNDNDIYDWDDEHAETQKFLEYDIMQIMMCRFKWVYLVLGR